LEFLKTKKDKKFDQVHFVDQEAIDYLKSKGIALENKYLIALNEILYFLHLMGIISVRD
jgi:hypothetical protein